MPKIVHVSRKAFEQGEYADYPIAIRIADSLSQLADVNNQQQQSYAFAFLDVEEDQVGVISQTDAGLIAHVLLTAKANNENVVVHCEAGVSRSGAVAQFAIDALGFEDEVAPATEEGDAWRVPNKLVMSRLRSVAIIQVGMPAITSFSQITANIEKCNFSDDDQAEIDALLLGLNPVVFQEDVCIDLLDQHQIDAVLEQISKQQELTSKKCKERDDFLRMVRNVEQSHGMFTKAYIVQGDHAQRVCESKEEAEELCDRCNEYQAQHPEYTHRFFNWSEEKTNKLLAINEQLNSLHPLGKFSETNYQVIEADYQIATKNHFSKGHCTNGY
jgi:predicted protein tyrosine phosphatase